MNTEQIFDFPFPLGGLNLSIGYRKQPGGTTPLATNIRGIDPIAHRFRGGSRPGIAKYIGSQVSGENLIQHLDAIVGVGYSPPGGSMQNSISGRVVTLVSVSNGTIKAANAGDAAWSATTNGTSALNTSGPIYSAVNNQKMYFADGVHWKVYDPSTNTVSTWSATAGSLPVDGSSNAPRLICTWRGRTVLSGLLLDPQNWFMSRVGDPTGWDYSPTSISSDQAVAGNNAPFGLVGDVITTLIPYRDDRLIFGCDHTIWQMSGDPMSGGQLDLISSIIGMAWGIPWCVGPDAELYFFSNRTGIYMMAPDQRPVRMSQQIQPILQNIDTGTNTIRMAWDERFMGLHVFITPTSSADTATHLFWEKRSGAWWQDSFVNENHNPLCCCAFDGNRPEDRVVLLGSWDGYTRYFDTEAEDDDGYDISSQVVLGPILTTVMDDMLLKDVQAVLADSSGDVSFSIHVGPTAESALNSNPVIQGTWKAGRNLTNLVRRSGYAVYIKLSSTNLWAMEQIKARIIGQGKVRRRGKFQ
jgi:hypothetical protein